MSRRLQLVLFDGGRRWFAFAPDVAKEGEHSRRSSHHPDLDLATLDEAGSDESAEGDEEERSVEDGSARVEESCARVDVGREKVLRDVALTGFGWTGGRASGGLEEGEHAEEHRVGDDSSARRHCQRWSRGRTAAR